MLHAVQAGLPRRLPRQRASRFPSPVLAQPPPGHALSFGHTGGQHRTTGAFFPAPHGLLGQFFPARGKNGTGASSPQNFPYKTVN
ncbi:hypothetical protein [Azospirillum argentinense]